MTYQKTQSAHMVAQIVGYDEKALRTWKKEFYDNKGEMFFLLILK